jgi:hypothetical protein
MPTAGHENHAPVVTKLSEPTLQPGESVPLSRLISVADPDGDPITTVELHTYFGSLNYNGASDPTSSWERNNGYISVNLADLDRVRWVAPTAEVNQTGWAFAAAVNDGMRASDWAYPTVNVVRHTPPALSLAAVSADRSEGNSGSTGFTFTVSRASDPGYTSQVNYAVTGSGSHPASGNDFANGYLPSGSLSLASGETSKSFTVNIAGDSVFEFDETFTVTLSNPIDATLGGPITATGTIRNDDTMPALNITANDANRNEGNSGSTPFTFTVTRSSDPGNTAWVNYVVTGSGGNPASANDFSPGWTMPSGSISFTPGETSKTLTIDVAGDASVEADETFSVTLNTPSDAVLGGSPTASATIHNDDTLQTLSISAPDAEVSEGSGGTTAAWFWLSRSGDTNADVSVDYSVEGSGGNPASASDFQDGALPSGTLHFAPGNSLYRLLVWLDTDTHIEPDEGFTVKLSNPSGALLGSPSTASMTIRNDDTPPMLSIAATDADKSEGDDRVTAFGFTVTRSGDTSGDSTATYSVEGSGNNPASATDFYGRANLPGGTVHFLPGDTSLWLPIYVDGETHYEPDETFTVKLSNPSGAILAGSGTASGTIRNDDQAAVFTIAASDADKIEGNGGPSPFTFTISRSGDINLDSTVNYSVAGSGGNAATAADFAGGSLPSGSVSFVYGETSKSITLDVAGDLMAEPDETFTVALSNPSGALLGGASSASATIRNDDTAIEHVPTVEGSIPPQVAIEGQAYSYRLPFGLFNDADGDSLTWTATQSNGLALPYWLAFHPDTQSLSGTAPTGAGDFNLRIIVDDGHGGAASTDFALATPGLAQVNHAPTVAGTIPFQSSTEGQDYSYQLPIGLFADADGDTLAYTAVRTNGSALPYWLSFNAGTKSLSGTVPTGAPDLNLRIVADDGFGGAVSTDFVLATPAAVAVINPFIDTGESSGGPSGGNTAPLAMGDMPAQILFADTAFKYVMPASTFHDADGDKLAYTATLDDGSRLPSWLKFKSSTRTFSGTVPSDAQDMTVLVTARDPSGEAAESYLPLSMDNTDTGEMKYTFEAGISNGKGDYDYYYGYVFDNGSRDYFVGQVIDGTDKKGNYSWYFINGEETANRDAAKDGNVYVESYFDSETGITYTPKRFRAGKASGVGQGLGFESDTIVSGTKSSRFGGAGYGVPFLEADLKVSASLVVFPA